MAKVELVEEQKKPYNWEPFATITVSKRELAGLHKLIGASHYRLIGGETYSQINTILEKITSGTLGYNDIKVTVPDSTIATLDNKYGEV